MGFIREKYSNNQGSLIVSFQGNQNTENYCASNNIQEALTYFNMYVKDNQIYIRTEEELALSETGISTIEEAAQLREELNEIVSNMTDEEAKERPILFPKWQIGIAYTTNTRVRYGGRIFKVLQAHTSTEEWTPSRAPSLYTEILTSEDDEPLEWVQPSSTNPYLTGDKVVFNGDVYQSLIDNNIWSPVDYPQGWELISGSEEQEEEDIESISEWEQRGSQNPYMIGDKVLFNGQTYESLINNNIWSPESYPAGWQLI